MGKQDFLSPVVSIGMPVFNGSDYLAESIEALLGQSFSDFELIISDNASTDSTAEIVKGYQETDRRIRYQRNPTNLGGAYNDNAVVALARGKYFKWAAHDDICAPEFVARCVAILEADPAIVLCYPKTNLIDEKGEIIAPFEDNYHLVEQYPHERYRQVLNKYQMLNSLYGVIRLEALKNTRLIKSYQDSDRVLLAELALQGKFFEVPEVLFFRRIHPEKSTEINTSAEDFAVWYDPSQKGKIAAPKTRRFFGFLMAIFILPIRMPDRLRCLREFVRFYFSPSRIPERFKALNKDVTQAKSVLSRLVSRD